MTPNYRELTDRGTYYFATTSEPRKYSKRELEDRVLQLGEKTETEYARGMINGIWVGVLFCVVFVIVLKILLV